MANKAFLGPLDVQYGGGIPPILVTNQIVVMDPQGNVVADPLGNIDISFSIQLNYADSTLTLKNKLIHAIRDKYGDQTIQPVYVNDLSGTLNIL